jgi:hypothetical protein
VNDKLHDERLLHRWQVEYLRPGLAVEESVSGLDQSGSPPAGDRVVGALLVPRLSASLPPRSTELLPAPDHAASRSRSAAVDASKGKRAFPRVALVVSGPYGGNTVVSGLLARFLGAGHIRAEDFVRYSHLSGDGRRRPASLAPSDSQSVAGPEDAIPVGRGLARVFKADYPAAWTISIGTEYLDAYEPLVAQVRSTQNVVIAIRHAAKDETRSTSWRRMAAWCLGVKSVHERRSQDERAVMRALFNPRRPQWSSMPGGPASATVELSPDEVVLLEEVRQSAGFWFTKLTGRSGILDGLLSARADKKGGALERPSIQVSLPSFADQKYPWFEQVGSTLQSRTGEVPDSVGDSAVFYEDFNLLVDMWTKVALDVLDQLLMLAGHDPVEGRELLVERCSDREDILRRAVAPIKDDVGPTVGVIELPERKIN